MLRFEEIVIDASFANKLLSKRCSKLYSGQEPNYKKIMEFSRIMREGNWKINEDDSPISVSVNGELMNGFHRLMAIIDSGTSIKEKIAFDVPELVFNPEKSSGKEYNVFYFACAEFVLDYLNVQTRSMSTVEKICEHIQDNLRKFSNEKQNWNRFDCAKVVAAIYALECGIDEKEILELYPPEFDKKTTPNNHFEKWAKIFCNLENQVFTPRMEILLPKTIFQSAVSDDC